MKKVIICVNYRANPGQPSCAARGSKDLAQRLESEITGHKISIGLERSDCLGFCDVGPNLKLVPEGQFLHHCDRKSIPEILLELERFARPNPQN